MNTTTIQIPINKSVRDQAASNAERMGFSSLQEVIRLFLNRIATGEIGVTFQETVNLSPKAVKRYNKMIDEIESGKVKPKSFTNVNSLMEYLNEDSTTHKV